MGIVGYTEMVNRKLVPGHTSYRHDVACACVLDRFAQAPGACGLAPFADLRLAEMRPGLIDARTMGSMSTWIAGLPASVEQPRSGGLVLYGMNGRGKTWLGAALANEARLASVRVRFAREVDMVSEVHDCYRPDSERNSADVERRYASVPLLVIDDAGQGASVRRSGRDEEGDGASKLLYRILDARLLANRPTIITTNVRKADWPAVWGNAVASRLNSMTHVYFEGPDLR